MIEIGNKAPRMGTAISTICVALLALGLVILAGCAGSIQGTPFSGEVHWGPARNPVAGSTVTLYAVGRSGYGTGAEVLARAKTDSAGKFSISSYQCPASYAETYLTAIGGDTGNGSNSSIGLIAPVGLCGGIQSSTTIDVDELTTVAAEWALAQFADPTGALIGSPPAGVTGLENAYAVFSDLAARESAGDSISGALSSFLPSVAQCSSSSPPANCSALEKLDTIANVLAACVNSAGTNSGPCFTLLSDTGLPTGSTTLAAAHAMAIHPANAVGDLFNLQGAPGSLPFQPALVSAPTDFTLALNFSGGGLAGPAAITIDAAGNAWVANDSGVVVEFAPGGKILSGSSGYTGGGMDHSFAIACDAKGNVWVANKYTATTNGTVAELSPDGSVLSGSSGYTAGEIDYPLAVALDPSSNVWVADYANASVTRNPQSTAAARFTGGGLSFPVSITVDNSGNAWIANSGNDSVTKLDVDGHPVSGSNGYRAGGLNGPAAIAVDATDHVWIANYYGNSVTELNSDGTAAPDSPFAGDGLSGPSAIAIDGDGNVWLANYGDNSLSELRGSGAASPGKLLSGPSGFIGGAISGPTGVAIDPSGNVWIANFTGQSISLLVGAAVPVETPLLGPAVKP